MKFGHLTQRDQCPCNKFPDGKCPRRHPACQDTCPDMIAAKQQAKQRKERERANRAKDDGVIDFQVKQGERITRTKSRMV